MDTTAVLGQAVSHAKRCQGVVCGHGKVVVGAKVSFCGGLVLLQVSDSQCWNGPYESSTSKPLCMFKIRIQNLGL
ncbi:hypothetical protein Y1Q_0003008 [Alligator mississippiensis]|uniref:Uncharacterized protein n=1 Tax=Alligator mississippiensis TaxID=8496 RepID=A0A151MD22_ALLMI|nr:hypothetical protein Y1Q_0003008 [Alligator mississippiensis]